MRFALCNLAPVRRLLGGAAYKRQPSFCQSLSLRNADSFKRVKNFPRGTMNTIIYIVGLVVIIGIILSYFGFR